MASTNSRLKPHDYVMAAVNYMDEHGLDAMTMRALGDALGVDATAVYRHFPNKESLLGAMVNWFLGEIHDRFPSENLEPRQQLVKISLAAREVFRLHPELGNALVQTNPGDGTNAVKVVNQSVSALKALGLKGADLVRCYQMFEGFLIGSCVQDFSRSPENFEIRRNRYRAIEIPEFDKIAVSADSVGKLADEAFLLGVNAILDRIIDIASR